MLVIDAALVSAAFPGWRIAARGQAWLATRCDADAGACSSRVAAIDLTALRASTMTDLAFQLAALECPLGITPTG